MLRLVVLAACAVGVSACDRGGPRTEPAVPFVYPGDADNGAVLIRRYGCGGCHVIPGVRGAEGLVGPPLTSFAHRAYVAGNLSNTPVNLVSWIMAPQAVEPGTAMPDLGVTEAHAWDIAAYLYSLR